MSGGTPACTWTHGQCTALPWPVSRVQLHRGHSRFCLRVGLVCLGTRAVCWSTFLARRSMAARSAARDPSVFVMPFDMNLFTAKPTVFFFPCSVHSVLHLCRPFWKDTPGTGHFFLSAIRRNCPSSGEGVSSARTLEETLGRGSVEEDPPLDEIGVTIQTWQIKDLQDISFQQQANFKPPPSAWLVLFP